MPNPSLHYRRVSELLKEVHGGRSEADQALMSAVHNRLRAIADLLTRSFPEVEGHEIVEQVIAEAGERILAEVKRAHMLDPLQFYRLAAVELKQAVNSVVRRHDNDAVNVPRACGPSAVVGRPVTVAGPAEETFDPRKAALWAEFHDAIEQLAPEHRKVTELIWFQGLSSTEAAHLLQTDEATVRRRWRRARLSLHAKLSDSQR